MAKDIPQCGAEGRAKTHQNRAKCIAMVRNAIHYYNEIPQAFGLKAFHSLAHEMLQIGRVLSHHHALGTLLCIS
jgi:hypothetical protein